MRVGVVGAGVVGVTTAHALHEQGLDVTVFEAEEQAGLGASFANAGQLAYAHATPLGSPDILRQGLNILAGRARGVSVGWSLDRRYLAWVVAFLRQCFPDACERNAQELAALARSSKALMQRFHQSFGCDYHYARRGKIVLHGRQAPRAEDLDGDALLAIEPALASWQLPVTSGSYSANDEVGDARRFSHSLACRLAGQGVPFWFGQRVTKLLPEGAAWRVVTERGDLVFDRVVVCSGNGAVQLLAPLDLSVPVFPVAGFSYSFPVGDSANLCSITVADHRLVFSRIGEELRIAGYAAVNQTRKALNAQAQRLLATARRLAPEAAQYDDAASPWIGYRPATPSSLPLVGRSPRPNLFYNFGHGMLGWTLGAATAHQVAGQVAQS